MEYVSTSLNSADCLTKAACERLHRLHTGTLCGLDWDADHDSEYQQELAEDQRSGAFESRKAMLDLEYQHEPEKRQELKAPRAHSDELADATGRNGCEDSDICRRN